VKQRSVSNVLLVNDNPTDDHFIEKPDRPDGIDLNQRCEFSLIDLINPSVIRSQNFLKELSNNNENAADANRGSIAAQSPK
jgi:hypothetical protein